MDPLIVFDAERVIPNRFSLAVAAAGRARALGRGAEPRLPDQAASDTDLALGEIAAGAFKSFEIEPFVLAGSLPWRDRNRRRFRPMKLRGGGKGLPAPAPALQHRAVP